MLGYTHACEGMSSVVSMPQGVECGEGGGPQSHSPHPSLRDNLYRVELEPPTSTELRYQRVRRGRRWEEEGTALGAPTRGS